MKKGFTLVELTLSMLFIGLLSLAVVLVINNAIKSYQRGATLTRIDSTGNNLVDDMRTSIQSSSSLNDLGKNISITKYGSVEIDGTVQDDVPLYGVFCSGDYSFVWNSGYFFSNEAKLSDQQKESYAKVKISEDNYLNSGDIFKLIKVKDQSRSICKSALYEDNGTYRVNENPLNSDFIITPPAADTTIEAIELLPNNEVGDLAIYDLTVSVPAVNASEDLSLYSVSFILGTTTGGVTVSASGSSCVAPIGEQNFNNSCAINQFNFVAQSQASDVGQPEITPADPTPTIPEDDVQTDYQIIYQPNCNADTSLRPQVYTFNGQIKIRESMFSCPNNDFLYWYTKPKDDGSGKRYNPDEEVTPNGSLTLYAIWNVKTYTCNKQYRLENADGTWSSYVADAPEQVEYGKTCNYSKSLPGYKNSASGANDTAASTSGNSPNNNDITLSLDLYRNTYSLNVIAGSNTSNPTGGGTYRWGQAVTVGVTKIADGTCGVYSTPSWVVSSGTPGSFGSTSGTSVNYTIPMGDSAVTASSTGTEYQQTITFKTVNANSITFNGSTKYNNNTISVSCGTYNISGSFPSGYQFSSWSATAGNLGNPSALNTTYTVTGPATITLTGAKTTYNVTYRRNCGGSSDTYTNVKQVNAGSTHTVLSDSAVGFTCQGYTFDGWDGYTTGQSITVNGNITINAKWKSGCPSGFTGDWDNYICWKTTDQGGLQTHDEAKNSCALAGGRLPTQAEYARLINNNCVEASGGSASWCTAESVTPKGFGYHGYRLVLYKQTCTTLESACEIAKKQDLDSCNLYKSWGSIGQSYYDNCIATVNKKYNCPAAATNCVTNLVKDTTTDVNQKGIYWANPYADALVIIKGNGGPSTATPARATQFTDASPEDSIYASVRCVADKK